MDRGRSEPAHGGSLRRSRVPLVLGIVIVLAALVTQVSRVKQWMLPAYATPERIKELFPQQLLVLRALAEGAGDKDGVAPLFADPAIEGASVINRYRDRNQDLVQVKAYTEALLQAQEAGILFPAEPDVCESVVNIWGSVAVYHAKIDTAHGLRGYKLAVSVAYLKSKAP